MSEEEIKKAISNAPRSFLVDKYNNANDLTEYEIKVLTHERIGELKDAQKLELINKLSVMMESRTEGITDDKISAFIDMVQGLQNDGKSELPAEQIKKVFAELLHSEKAAVIHDYHEKIKAQGVRTDMKSAKNPSENGKPETSVGLLLKSGARKETANHFGITQNAVWQYLQIHKLIAPLKKRLDDGELGGTLTIGVAISGLRVAEQEILNEVIENSKHKLDVKKADELSSASKLAGQLLSKEDIEAILKGENKPSNPKSESIQFTPNEIKQYFGDLKPNEYKSQIIKSLKLTQITIPKLIDEYFSGEIVTDKDKTDFIDSVKQEFSKPEFEN